VAWAQVHATCFVSLAMSSQGMARDSMTSTARLQ
jgi:hypothetical protein